jgi:hypothetical protein
LDGHNTGPGFSRSKMVNQSEIASAKDTDKEAATQNRAVVRRLGLRKMLCFMAFEDIGWIHYPFLLGVSTTVVYLFYLKIRDLVA